MEVSDLPVALGCFETTELRQQKHPSWVTEGRTLQGQSWAPLPEGLKAMLEGEKLLQMKKQTPLFSLAFALHISLFIITCLYVKHPEWLNNNCIDSTKTYDRG